MDASSNSHAALLIGNSAAALGAQAAAPAQPAPGGERAPESRPGSDDFSNKMRDLQTSEPVRPASPATASSQPQKRPASAADAAADPPSASDSSLPAAPGVAPDSAAVGFTGPADGGQPLPVDGQPLPVDGQPLPDGEAATLTSPPAQPQALGDTSALAPALATAGSAAPESGTVLPATELPPVAAAATAPPQGLPGGDDVQPATATPAVAAAAGSAENPRPLPPGSQAPVSGRSDPAQAASLAATDTPLSAATGGDNPATGHGQAGDSQGRHPDQAAAAALRDILLPAQPAARGPAFADAVSLAASLPGTSAASSPPPALGDLLGQPNQGLAQQLLQPLAGQEQFAKGLGDRLTLLAGNGLQAARIQLHPAQLGALDVRIELDENQARVWFHAQHAATREALEQAMPRLRELFASQGMELLDAGVSGGQEQNAENHAAQQPPDWLASRRLAEDFDQSAFATRSERRLGAHRLLDVRA